MPQKYKIVISSGCTANYTLVNGKNLDELGKEAESELLDYIFLKIKEGLAAGTCSFNELIGVLQYSDTEYDSKVCDQCFDSVERTIWEI